MLRTIAKQFLRPITTFGSSSTKYQWSSRRSFSSNKHDYGGLSVDDTQVQKYLMNAVTEYNDLVKRKESLGRDGHEKIRELQRMVETFKSRNAVIDNLKILNEEMAKEKNSELLEMMNDEKKVSIMDMCAGQKSA